MQMFDKLWDEEILIEQRMQDRYDEIIKQFRQYIHEDLIDEVVACIGLALHDETKEAEKIADLMGFSQADISCINGNFDEFKKNLVHEYEDQKASYLMENYP